MALVKHGLHIYVQSQVQSSWVNCRALSLKPNGPLVWAESVGSVSRHGAVFAP